MDMNHVKFKCDPMCNSDVSSHGPYHQYYAYASYYNNANVDLARHLAATKPSFFLFIHMVSLPVPKIYGDHIDCLKTF